MQLSVSWINPPPHLDTFSHVYRENSIYNNAPPPRPDGTVHGDAASVRSMVGRGVLLDMETVAVGADNAAVEWGFRIDPNYKRKAFGGYATGPMHPDFLWSRGAYIIEMLNLEWTGPGGAQRHLSGVASGESHGLQRPQRFGGNHPAEPYCWHCLAYLRIFSLTA
jgi:hypothetical protein